MKKKYPQELYILITCFVFGIMTDGIVLFYQVRVNKPLKQIIIMGLPSVILICMITLLFVKKKWAYIIIWILYLPIAICGFIVAVPLLYMNAFFTLLLPLCGVTTLYSLFSDPLQAYFSIKIGKRNSASS